MLLDWIKGGRRQSPTERVSVVAWHVYLDGADVVADDGKGHEYRVPTGGARSVRIVPLGGGSHHAQTSGWQVALSRADGDVLLGKPLQDWQTAREVARQVCVQTDLPLDELTQRMFSRVGQFTRQAKE